MPSQKILKSRGSETLFIKAFSVAFFLRKVSLEQNQDKAIMNCLILPHASHGPVATLQYL